MTNPKLVLLHGFAGVGKTTIAERYAGKHPLTMILEAERVGAMLSRWLEHEARARELLLKLGQVMTATCLSTDHDVVIPMLPTNSEHVSSFERIAREAGAQFFEVVLVTKREEAIQRLLKRGTWGEEGAPPVTEADLPIIEKMYDDMASTLAERPGAVRIASAEGDHDGMYQQFLAAIGEG
jgi:predicted kinase